MENQKQRCTMRLVIVRLQQEGWSYPKIANKVGISPRTVRRYAAGHTSPTNQRVIAELNKLLRDKVAA